MNEDGERVKKRKGKKERQKEKLAVAATDPGAGGESKNAPPELEDIEPGAAVDDEDSRPTKKRKRRHKKEQAAENGQTTS